MQKRFSFGFIGCGNMGGALAAAVCRSVGGENVAVCDFQAGKTAALKERFGAVPTDIHTLARNSRFVFLGVKPQMFGATVADIRDDLAGRQDEVILVTMAAGITVSALAGMLAKPAPIARIMPNTPVSVGEGLILYCRNGLVSDAAMNDLLTGLGKGGKCFPVTEEKIDAGSAVSGCGPAFACLFIEALADAGVECGLTRADAQGFAAQMLIGTGKLVQESGQHPGVLKDAVCSPGGTTIAGVRALEEGGFRAATMNAVLAAYRKTLELKK